MNKQAEARNAGASLYASPWGVGVIIKIAENVTIEFHRISRYQLTLSQGSQLAAAKLVTTSLRVEVLRERNCSIYY